MTAPDFEITDLTNQSIFLSYRSRNEPEVHGLSILLKNLGSKVTKMGEFPPGRWNNYIDKELEASDVLLIYLSREPRDNALRRLVSALLLALKRLFNWLLRRSDEPDNWMREEFERFKKFHGEDRKVVIYAEQDVDKPEYLKGQQMHFYVSQLTALRQKWNKMKADNVTTEDAKRIILAELKEHGVDLSDGAVDQAFDMFGVHNWRSSVRYMWYRAKYTLVFVPLMSLLVLLSGTTYFAGQANTRKVIPVPGVTRVDINLNQSGRTACQKIDMVCVSVAQTEASYGNKSSDKFYGYATPTCESRLVRSTECPRTYGHDYEMTSVFYSKSSRNETPTVNLGREAICWRTDVYQSANCVAPLGD